MAYLFDLMLSGLPSMGSRKIIGSCGPFRRTWWAEGEYIVNESGHMLECGLTAKGKPRQARAWKPYAEDLLMNDWEPAATPSVERETT